MKRTIKICLCLLVIVLMAGCGKGEEIKPNEPYVYYIMSTEPELVKHGYEWKADNTEQEVKNILSAMKDADEAAEYISAIPGNVKIDKIVLSEGKLDLYFSEGYNEMSKAEEVLCRAAVVKSLMQVGGIESIGFFVGDAPLMDKDGVPVGYMNEDSFVRNIGPALNSYQEATFKLFYANKKGDKLVSETVSVRYNSNMSVEKAIVEQLLKGPTSDKAAKTLPTEAKVLSVSVKDGICYVNFNEGFLGEAQDIDPKIAIYSLVNSIVEGGDSSQVQIAVNGETDIMFRGTFDLSKPISRDLDLVEEIKK